MNKFIAVVMVASIGTALLILIDEDFHGWILGVWLLISFIVAWTIPNKKEE